MEGDTTVIPYEYLVELDTRNIPSANEKFTIYFKDNKMKLDKNVFKFLSLKKLSIKDIGEMLKGTERIIRISGEFANDK